MTLSGQNSYTKELMCLNLPKKVQKEYEQFSFTLNSIYSAHKTLYGNSTYM